MPKPAMASRYQAVKLGGPFETVQTEHPGPKADEVLIRLKAIGLNPIDWKQLTSGRGVDSWPAVFGNEGSGIVEAVGPEVQAFKKGDEVLARFEPRESRSAAFQEYSVIKSTQVAPKPASLSYEDAASIPVGFMTAASAIYHALEIPLQIPNQEQTDRYSPKSILVLGGSSSVGAATIQLLRIALPYATILSTSSPKHHIMLKSLGAAVVFDYKSTHIVQEIRLSSPHGAGVEAIIDAVGSVATNSMLLQTLIHPKLFAEVVTEQMAGSIPADVKHTLVFGRKAMAGLGGTHLFATLGELLASKEYRLPLPVTVVGVGLGAIEHGLQKLKTGVSGTKLVVTV